MRRTESKTKSVRRPLRDLTNDDTKRSFSKSEIPKKKMIHNDIDDRNNSSLDRLLLLHSDVSSLLRQIDELVVQAYKVKATEHGRNEIEAFTSVISDILSSLKPWVPRFQKALSSPAGDRKDQPRESFEPEIVPFVNVNEKECFDVGSPEEETMDSLISPSPLVSWRAADCKVEGGRQLFLLTPLPISKALSSKMLDSSKSVFKGIASRSNVELASFLNIPGDENDDLLEGVELKATPFKPSDSVVAETDNTFKCEFVSSPVFSKRNQSMLPMTPCLKMSPPKSCALLEPIHESPRRGNYVMRKSTPFPLGINNSGFSESSGSEEASEDLTLKYPELRGIQRTYVSGIGKKDLESSPMWLFSPPKSCILLEPPDEKSVDNAGTDHHLASTGVINQQRDIDCSKRNGVTDVCQKTKTTNQENTGNNVESTPMWKEPQSTIRTGKHPGENTLKKELWTKFEAVSTCGLRYNASAIQRTARKGFLDMLDEVSCDDESPLPDCSR